MLQIMGSVFVYLEQLKLTPIRLENASDDCRRHEFRSVRSLSRVSHISLKYFAFDSEHRLTIIDYKSPLVS